MIILRNKNLNNTNLKGLDMSNKSFDNVLVKGANLEDTNADIDPQKDRDKSLYKTNLKGLDMSSKSFESVDAESTNLENTGACITSSTLIDENTILEGCKVEFEEAKKKVKTLNLRKKEIYL